MASFVYAVWSITNVASVHCAVRPEISPCTCEPIYSHNHVELSCEKVDSFHQIVDALSNKFEPSVNISLKITHSQLDDLEMRSFTDMNLNVVKLRMQWNGLKSMPELPFRGLSNVEFLSIGDNDLDEIPKHMLNHMPMVKTLDMGRCHIRSVLQDDFKGIQHVTYLFLPSNNITRLDKGAFPNGVATLHLGRNQIENLNGTLRDLNKLESLFINMNSISTLDEELPESNRLKLIIAQNNRLERLPESMRYLNKLETVHLQYNRLRSLDGIFSNAKNLNQFYAFNNEIEYLAQNEFQSSELMEELNLAFNHIKALNHSLLPLQRLYSANFSFNEIDEFSMNEIRGLMHLKQLDLSYNLIQKLTGRQENKIDQNSFLIEFILDHNQLKSLDGALMGLNSLRILSLSFNQIERILPEDFIGLVKLEILELSHNQLLTLKEMETTFLPNLKILKVAHNNLTKLEKDFHGLPVLCQANLTNNQISSISTELLSETRCMNHNVPGKLELHLDDNPIMCDERLNELCPIMLAQETRIRGRSQCFESDQEVCTVLPMLFTPGIISDNIPIILQQQLHQPATSQQVMQVIVPTPILLNKNKKSDDNLPPLIASLGQPIIKPLIMAQVPNPISTSTLPTTTTTTTTTSTTSTTTPATLTTSSSTNAELSSYETTTLLETLKQQQQTINSDTDNITKRSDKIMDIQESEIQNTSISITNNDTGSNNVAAAVISLNDTINIPITPSITTTTAMPLEVIIPETVPLVLNIEEPTGIVPTGNIQADIQILATATGLFSPSMGVATSGSATQTEYATVEYIPNLDEILPIDQQGSLSSSSLTPSPPSSSPSPPPPPPPLQEQSPAPSPETVETLDEDSKSNSVHEEFPTAVLADLDNPQSLLIPEEPPENP